MVYRFVEVSATRADVGFGQQVNSYLSISLIAFCANSGILLLIHGKEAVHSLILPLR